MSDRSGGHGGWKTLRQLRPNWVWWSVDEGWSIDEEEVWQASYALPPEGTGDAVGVADGIEDDLLSTAEREAQAAAQPTVIKDDGAASSAEEGDTPQEGKASDPADPADDGSLRAAAASGDPAGGGALDMEVEVVEKEGEEDGVATAGRGTKVRHDRNDGDYVDEEGGGGERSDGSDAEEEPTEVSPHRGVTLPPPQFSLTYFRLTSLTSAPTHTCAHSQIHTHTLTRTLTFTLHPCPRPDLSTPGERLAQVGGVAAVPV